jgi:LysR family transcriptional regulator for metE and metH
MSMQPLESRDLRLVRAIVDGGGATRAGALLHLSQSAVSHQLAALEARLGLPLFERVGRRLVATGAGERLASASRELEAQLTRVAAEVHDAAAPRRVLRVATECYTCYHWLPPLLERFHAAHPGVDVEIALDATRRPLPLLLDGRLDLAIVSQPFTARALAAEPLFADELVLIARADHRLARRAFVRPEDLADETLFTHELATADVRRLERTLFAGARAIKPKHVHKVPLTEAIVELVRAGLGVSLLGRWAVEPQLRAGGLAARPLGKRGVFRSWRALFRKDDDAAPRAFARLLRERRARSAA